MTWARSTQRAIMIEAQEVFVAAIKTWPPLRLAAAHDDPLMFLLPVLDIETTITSGSLTDYDHRLRLTADDIYDVRLDQVEHFWINLRALKDSAEVPFDAFLQFDTDQNGGRTQQEEECLHLLERHRRTMHQVNLTEQLARDYNQLRIACMGLEASRTSIRE